MAKARKRKVRLKPNGEPDGTFLVSIDDGWSIPISSRYRAPILSKAFGRIYGR